MTTEIFHFPEHMQRKVQVMSLTAELNAAGKENEGHMSNGKFLLNVFKKVLCLISLWCIFLI